MLIEISFALFREFCRCCAAGHCMFVNKRCLESNCPVWLHDANIRAQEAEEEIDNSTQQTNTAICPTCNGSKTVPRYAFDLWGALCPQCGGTDKQQAGAQ